MELSLSADQELLRASTHSFLEKECGSPALRRLQAGEHGFDRGWWSTAAGLGWTSLLVPEGLDGGSVSGGALQDLAILAEEAGRFAAPGPLAVGNAVIAALTWRGSRDHANAVAAIMSGAAVATWAVYEPGCGWDPRHPLLAARRDGEDYRLTGIKDRVEAGDQADLFLVNAALDGAARQFLVPATTPGVTVARVWSLDFTRHFATVTFDDARLPAGAIVGPAESSAAMIEWQWQVICALQCAEIGGVTGRAFEMGLDWAMDRVAFGRPLASYQAIKHRFADMRAWLEAMHALTAGAVKAVQDRAPDAALLIRAAKVFAATRAGEIIQDIVQIHGGIGVTWEHDLHLFLRRATVDRALYATPEELRAELSALLQAGEELA